MTNVTPIEIEEIVAIDEMTKYDTELLQQLTTGIREHQKELDDIIHKAAPQWTLAQIKKIDLEILRIAIYEGFVGKITPPKVAIDEAIELAKDFGGETSGKFVNGVLGGLYEKQPKTK